MTQANSFTRFDTFAKTWIPEIEGYMKERVNQSRPVVDGLYAMMRYHLGWEDQQGRPEYAPQGKRVRPLVVLMACYAAGGDTRQAIPAAAAVELLHNFSLIHDDIEDQSPTRRHRPTLYSCVGEAQAINAGDAMFFLAHTALRGLSESGVPDARVLEALQVFDLTCLRLSEGQFLDMNFETQTSVSLDTYMIMIAGKTAALLAASAQLGALVADNHSQQAFWRFGHELGLSFQVQDDILGIWGDEAVTGKSAASDILTRKKTLPVLFAFSQTGPEAEALQSIYNRQAEITHEDLAAILALMERLGAREHAEAAAEHHARAALQALDETDSTHDGVAFLSQLATMLLGRTA